MKFGIDRLKKIPRCARRSPANAWHSWRIPPR